MTFSNVYYGFIDNWWHYYYHTRTFKETNGVGINLTWGEIWLETQGLKTSGNVDYRIEGNGEYIWNDNFFTSEEPDEFTLKYWGIDDNRNPVYVEQVMTVSGSFHEP